MCLTICKFRHYFYISTFSKIIYSHSAQSVVRNQLSVNSMCHKKAIGLHKRKPTAKLYQKIYLVLFRNNFFAVVDVDTLLWFIVEWAT